ncbi:WbqC family protein [Stutzerimonas xanthomarina]|uniref:WbqC family protein n=1 Tax=Stutzerimonas xanthomarina TaxID=271420 RepID=UPI003AA7F554
MLRTISMMQPYLFPYLGYFQLIARSDVFVLGDDLQYVKGSWINRNRVLANGQPKLITFPLRKANQFFPINQRWLCDEFELEAQKLLKTLELVYSRAPHKAEVMTLVRQILAHPERNLARFIENSIRRICAYLQIATPIRIGSEMGLPARMDKQERVVTIAHKMNAELYVNPIGGTALYCPAYFRSNGLVLRFLQMDDLSYPQFNQPFVPSLSIIDVLMFNSRSEAQALLKRFSLVEGVEHSTALQGA